jgi:single-strand DNA-binding protein
MLNKVMLIGHLGKDPDVRTLDSGTKVCQFTLATTEKGYTLQNGTQVPDRTEWHNIVLWKGLAEVAGKYLHKGDKVFIEGKIRSRSYEDNSKVKRYITEIFADNMEILSTSKSGSQDSSSRNNSSSAPLPSGTPSDDLPF